MPKICAHPFATSAEFTFARSRKSRWGGSPWLALAVSAACWPLAAQAQIFTYNFADVTNSSGQTSAGGTAANLTFSNFTATNVSANSSGAGRFSFSNQSLGATDGSDTFTGAIDLTKYYEFTITPAAGYSLDLNSLNFVLQRSATGIRQYAVRSSLDSFADNLAASIEPANTNLSVVPTNVFQVADPATTAQNGSTLTLGGAYDALTSAVTFRFYGFNAEGGGGTFSLDDVTSFGSVTFVNARNLTWTPSAGESAWNTTATNWTLSGGGATAFMATDNVTFTDAGLALGSTVTIDPAGVTPNNVNVQNTTGTYTLTGGALTAGGTFTKSNAGTLVLDTAVGASAIVISGGTVKTTTDERLTDTTTVTITGPAVLDLDGHAETIGALTLTGAATLQTGAGTVTLGGNVNVNASSATPIIKGQINGGNALRTVNVADGAAAVDLQLDAQFTGGARVGFAGAGLVALNGDNSAYFGGFSMNSSAIVRLGHQAALGLGQLFFNDGILSALADFVGANAIAATVSLGPGNTTLGGTSQMEFAGAWTFFQTTARTLTVQNTSIFTGGMNGTIALTKAGTGTMIFPTSASLGSLTISNGTVEVTTPAALGLPALDNVPIVLNPASPNTATLRLKVASITFPSLAGSGTGTASIVLGDTGVNTELVVGTAGTSTTYNGSITVNAGSTGRLTKEGGGNFILSGASTLNGPTTVNGGGLLISGSLAGTSLVQVSNIGTVLGGKGTITLPATGTVALADSTMLAPGDGPGLTGTLSISGTPLTGGNFTLSLASGSAFTFELGSTVLGGSQLPANAGLNDLVALTGNVSLTGATLTGSLLDGFKTSVNDLFFLIINDGSDAVNGVFLDAPQNTVISLTGPEGSVDFQISYTGNSATNAFTGGNDVVLQALAAIPEPGSTALLATATGLLALRRRRAA